MPFQAFLSTFPEEKNRPFIIFFNNKKKQKSVQKLCFSQNLIFWWHKLPTKFQNPRTTPSRRKVCDPEKKNNPKFCWCQWASLLPSLHMFHPLLNPPSTQQNFFSTRVWGVEGKLVRRPGSKDPHMGQILAFASRRIVTAGRRRIIPKIVAS